MSRLISTGITELTHPIRPIFVDNVGPIGVPEESASWIST